MSGSGVLGRLSEVGESPLNRFEVEMAKIEIDGNRLIDQRKRRRRRRCKVQRGGGGRDGHTTPRPELTQRHSSHGARDG